jgi:hypothetical protein
LFILYRDDKFILYRDDKFILYRDDKFILYRDEWTADGDWADVPVDGLMNDDYLDLRARQFVNFTKVLYYKL